MRRRRTGRKQVRSWERVATSVVSPSITVAASGTKAGSAPTQPHDLALVSPDAKLMGGVGTVQILRTVLPTQETCYSWSHTPNQNRPTSMQPCSNRAEFASSSDYLSMGSGPNPT
jgi:hypothetical protein